MFGVSSASALQPRSRADSRTLGCSRKRSARATCARSSSGNWKTNRTATPEAPPARSPLERLDIGEILEASVYPLVANELRAPDELYVVRSAARRGTRVHRRRRSGTQRCGRSTTRRTRRSPAPVPPCCLRGNSTTASGSRGGRFCQVLAGSGTRGVFRCGHDADRSLQPEFHGVRKCAPRFRRPTAAVSTGGAGAGFQPTA